MPQHQPFVSIVTPVYNGDKFLEQCIESALAQSHTAFEFVILDNASTDDTNVIAAAYARKDERIRLHRNDSTLPLIENWNRALSFISPDSHYTRILHADDTMYPDCLEKCIAVAERNPSAGIVGSLRLRGKIIECEGLPRNREVFSGPEIARGSLRKQVFALAPTSNMIRSDLVRARQPFYPTNYLHADLAAYYDLLKECDFGFVHEVLAFSRVHADSITTTIAERNQTLLREGLLMLQHYGPDFFPPDELVEVEQTYLRRYYRSLIRGAITRRSPDFVRYHLAGLQQANRTPTPMDLLRAASAEITLSVLHPGKLVRHFAGRRPAA
jgi:glycosyltransferase involved in cell wall biosynthesis